MYASESHPRPDASEKIQLESEIHSPDVNLKTEVLDEDDGEVFRSHTGTAEFRALGW